ncbi:MAG: isoamylase early set domain-containing protein [Candidatus Eisenbacteria bacterium]|nr:isoamylase early set domain-containing protein [Candidatus Eisenbacteria bacterium]MCC7141139.1 isoamylase early set domain-containing protein [Candidatus Eisenbacteria bacterium]
MIQMLGGGWVRFRYEESAEDPVYLVGDFNQWNETADPMDRAEDGGWVTTLKLNPGEYEFKYKTGHRWHNDRAAHKYVANVWGSENSVVVVNEDRVQPGMETGA